MIRSFVLSLTVIILTAVTACDLEQKPSSPGPIAFAGGGQLNMVYDIRQRPQAVYLDGKVHIVFAGRTDEVPVGKKPSTRP
ncbi:MAG: hypothetical protein KAT00_12965, partial [Planctomycetes bacterium]|nr:hypothetical protein [Planctomycetota bacterium]